jgi:alpha-N-arabinofuranosidase
VLKRAGRVIDYISIHQYWGADDYYATVAAAAHVEKRLKLLASVLDVAEASLNRETPIEISFDEWNVWYRGRTRPWEEFYALKDAIFAAGVFNAMYRQCNRVMMANLAQMVNALGMMHTTPNALILSPIYHVFDFYANHTGRTVLDAAVVAEDATARETLTANIACAVYGRPTPPPRYVKGVAYVDAVATLDGTAERPTCVSIAAINLHETEPATLRVDLGPLPRSSGTITLHELTGPDGMQQNTVEQPDAVSPTSRRLEKWPSALTLSPRSVTILEWRR